MTPDEKHEIYMKGIEEGKKHSKPSPTTLARLDHLDNEMKRMIESFERHDNDERTQWNTIREVGAAMQRLEITSRSTLEQTTKTNGKVAEHERLIHNLELQATKKEDGLHADVLVLCEQFKTFNRRINRLEGMIWGVIVIIVGTLITTGIEHLIND